MIIPKFQNETLVYHEAILLYFLNYFQFLMLLKTSLEGCFFQHDIYAFTNKSLVRTRILSENKITEHSLGTYVNNNYVNVFQKVSKGDTKFKTE